jgi:hypothetical protein
MSPTELRILLSFGNLVLLYKSTVHLFGRAYRLFDVAGTIGISGMLLVLLISVIQNTAKLYRREPLPFEARGNRQQSAGVAELSDTNLRNMPLRPCERSGHL